ncbi:hypothetical protein D9M69_536380 [compost metagenome]
MDPGPDFAVFSTAMSLMPAPSTRYLPDSGTPASTSAQSFIRVRDSRSRTNWAPPNSTVTEPEALPLVFFELATRRFMRIAEDILDSLDIWNPSAVNGRKLKVFPAKSAGARPSASA